MDEEKLKALAKDLRDNAPSSPRTLLGGWVILQRCVDKCRSFLLGINGEYNYWPCSLCGFLETFSGVDHEEMKEFISTGASDEEVANWFNEKSNIKEPIEKIHWNNKMREMRLSELEDHAQEYLDTYIQEYVPKHRPVYVLFDIYDLEEGRL